MKKMTLYFAVAAILIVLFGSVMLIASSLNFISYLALVMLLPLLFCCVVIYFLFGRYEYKSTLIHSLGLGLFYVCALGVLGILLRDLGGFTQIYENSKILFTEGFSIGSDMGINGIGDMILPGGVSFLLFYLSASLSVRKSSKRAQELL